MSSLRARLTAALVALVAGVLIAFAVLMFLAVRRTAWQQHDAGLLARARAIASGTEHDQDGYELTLPPDPRDERATYVEAWLPDHKVLARSESLAKDDLPRTAATVTAPTFTDMTLRDGREGRAVQISMLPRDEVGTAQPVTLVLAEGTEDVDAAVRSTRAWVLGLGAGALLAVALVSSWLVRRGLRPLGELATHLEGIGGSQLATRVTLPDLPDELAVPVAKLNELLARLDAAFSRERQFTADVSHELRTPLAGLRTLLEVTQLAERSSEDYRAAIADALAISIELGALVENLLMLARIDHGQIALEVREIGLRELVDACWRPHAAAAEARGLVFVNAVPAEARVETDRDKLRIVVGNVLANAAEYTTTNGRIEVTSGPGDIVLDVVDSGPTIPEASLDKIFDRLWRGDTARSSTGVHCGIGLALARSLTTALGLTISAANRADGSVRFRVAR